MKLAKRLPGNVTSYSDDRECWRQENGRRSKLHREKGCVVFRLWILARSTRTTGQGPSGARGNET